MNWVKQILDRRRIFGDIDDEIQLHLEERTEELVGRGVSRKEASARARREFGNVSSLTENSREVWRWPSLESFILDLRYGARQLRLNPGFASVAVLSLALGIGANSAIFQLINALRLRSLPVKDAQELVAIDKEPDFFNSGWFSGRHEVFTYAQYEQMVLHQEAFTDVLAFGTSRFNLSQSGETRYAEGLYITPNFLEVLGVPTMLGTWLPSDKDPRDCSDAGALISHSFWQREFGEDPSAIGRDILLDGRNFMILGVTPPSFIGLEPARRFDVAVPLCADALFSKAGKGRFENRTAWWLAPIGRLKSGWSVEAASTHMRGISPAIFRVTQPTTYRPDAIERYLKNELRAISAQAGVSSTRREYESPLWILLASTALVLVIACANLANLLLARASARQREVALRQAIGASRRRLVAQLMSESSLLAGLGAVIGGLVAYLLSRGMVLFLAQGSDPLAISLALDWRVWGFTAGLAFATCLLFGLTPAIRATSSAPADAIRGGRGATSASESHGLRRALVVSQIAVSLVLLVGALLFGQSLRNLLETETGMVSEGVLIASITARLPDLEPERRLGVFRQLEERIDALPDVESASTVAFTPFGDSGWNGSAHADDDPATTGGKDVWLNRVSPGYFKTMRTPMFAGRDFEPHDDKSAPDVAVINELMARELFGSDNPIGRSFRTEASAGKADPTYRIVGLIKNTKYRELREDPRWIAFLPLAQDATPRPQMSIVVRARGSFSGVMAGVRQQMAELEPGLLVEFDMLDLQVARSVLRDRLMANLSGAFGLLAALLSTLGLYGVMSYMVVRRRSEIGIRMALGAQRGNIRGLVIAEAGRLVLIGLALGLAASFALSRYAESLLFGLQPNDATTLALGCSLLAVTAFAAALIPVRRATSLDPAVVLRDQ